MPFQLRLAAIVAAAVMTAAVHHRYLATQIEQREFVSAARALRIGEVPEAHDLQPIPLGGNLASLVNALVPWDERMMIVGTPLLRDFSAGELLARRDVEARAIGPYQPRGSEFVFVVELPDTTGLQNSFQIGSYIGFFLERRSGTGHETNIEECGPFVLRQYGPLSRQVDQRIMQQVSSRSVTLSLPAAPGGQRPARAQSLLNAVSGADGSRIIGLYHPQTKG